MTTADLPELTGTLLPVKFFPATIARTADTIATSAKGAASGVATLDTSGHIPYAQMAPGEVLRVSWDPVAGWPDPVAGWPAIRPTSRTDIQVRSNAPSSISAPASWQSNAPPWMILGDLFEIIDDGTPDPVALPWSDFTDPATGIVWTNFYAEDFLTNIPLGEVYPGGQSDAGALNPASQAYTYYNNSFKLKAVGNTTDLIGQYNSALTTSISNSVMDIWCHYDAPSARFVTGAVKPWLPTGAGVDRNYMTYGRVAYRMRWTGSAGDGAGYRAVALWINNNAWPANGELDWPEATPTGNVVGFFHPAQATNATAPVSAAPAVMSDWHNYVCEWFPAPGGSRTRWYMDDTLVYDRTDKVAVSPMTMGWQIQVGTNDRTPSIDSEAHLQIDWISMWKAS